VLGATRLVPPDELEERLARFWLEPRQRYIVPVARGRRFYVGRWVSR
jgi:hypothetical protein